MYEKTILRNGFYFTFEFKANDNDIVCLKLDKLTFKSISFESNSLHKLIDIS